ncbi:MAG: hypothetical protein ACE5GO_11785 [Anaerolineales bacterium]
MRIDFQHDLWGASPVTLSELQALHIFLLALFYAWWGLSLAWASHESRPGMVSLFGMTLVWSVLANGLGGTFGCLPPCAAMAPYADIFHIGNIVLGGFASYAIWQAIKANPEPGRGSWRTIFIPIGFLVMLWTLEGIFFFARFQ